MTPLSDESYMVFFHVVAQAIEFKPLAVVLGSTHLGQDGQNYSPESEYGRWRHSVQQHQTSEGRQPTTKVSNPPPARMTRTFVTQRMRLPAEMKVLAHCTLTDGSRGPLHSRLKSGRGDLSLMVGDAIGGSDVESVKMN
jgi:hypothetical protein